MNPYEPCVWNKMTMDKQLTLLFHAGDVMMIHSLSQILTEHIIFLDKGHVHKDPLTVTRGKVHEYLGMTEDFRNRGSVVFSQCDAIKKFFHSLPDYPRGVYRSAPAPENLFKVNVESPRLDKEKQHQCHSATAKCIYFSQRSRTTL